MKIKIVSIIIFFIILSSCRTNARRNVTNLTVEYTTTPLGIDVEQPRFGWQMFSSEDEHGIFQKAWQIIVKDASGEIVWDSGQRNKQEALAIPYEGSPL